MGDLCRVLFVTWSQHCSHQKQHNNSRRNCQHSGAFPTVLRARLCVDMLSAFWQTVWAGMKWCDEIGC